MLKSKKTHYETCKPSIERYYIKNKEAILKKARELSAIKYALHKEEILLKRKEKYALNKESISKKYFENKKKILCPTCNIEVVETYIKKHNDTKKHLNNLKK